MMEKEKYDSLFGKSVFDKNSINLDEIVVKIKNTCT